VYELALESLEHDVQVAHRTGECPELGQLAAQRVSPGAFDQPASGTEGGTEPPVGDAELVEVLGVETEAHPGLVAEHRVVLYEHEGLQLCEVGVVAEPPDWDERLGPDDPAEERRDLERRCGRTWPAPSLDDLTAR
jgi:hypothetical protein